MKATDRPEIIPEQEFKDHLKELGFSEDECLTAIREALNLGLFSQVVGRGGVRCYRIATVAEAAKIAGCKHPGKPVEIPLKEFLSKGLG